MAFKKSKAEFELAAKDKTARVFGTVKGRLQGLAQAARGAINPFTALAGIAGFTVLGKNTLKAADDIGKFADRAGVSTKELQKLRFAFDLSGVAQENFDKSLLVFGKRLGKARQGIGALKGGLKGGKEELLGMLTATNSTSEALDVIFNAMGNAKNQAEKLAIADAAFGTTGLNMTAAFNEGSEAFKAAKKEADRLDIGIGENLIRGAEEANNGINKISNVLGSEVNKAFLELVPVVTSSTETIIKAIKLTVETLKALGSGVNSFGKFIGESVAKVSLVLEAIPGKFNAIGASIIKMVETAKAWLGAKFTAITSAVGTQADKITGFFKGMFNKVVGNSFVPDMVTRIGEEFGKLDGKMISPAQKATDSINDAFSSAADSVSGSIADMVTSGGANLASFKDIALGIFKDITRGITQTALGSFKTGGSGLLGTLFSSVLGFLTGGPVGAAGVFAAKQAAAVPGIFGPGFATGGQFTVGGPGGTDRTPVSFMATRGERVTVETPAQQRRGNGTVINNINIDLSGANGDVAIKEMVVKAIHKASPHLISASVNQVKKERQRDPQFFR